MAKGKKKGGKRRGDDSDEDAGDNSPPPQKKDEEEEEGKQLSRKEKRLQKQSKKGGGNQQQKQNDSDDNDDLLPTTGANDYGSDSSNDNETQQPAKKLTKKQQKRQQQLQQQAAMMADSSEEEEVESEEEALPEPVKKLTKKQLKKLQENEAEEAARAKEDEEVDESEEEQEEEEEEAPPELAKKYTKKQLKKLKEQAAIDRAIKREEENEEKEIVEEMNELDISDKKEKKKDKKKKSKLEKNIEEALEKKEEEEVENTVTDDNDDLDEEAKEKAARKQEKAARKVEKEAKKARKAEKAIKKAAKEAAAATGNPDVDGEGDSDNEDGDVFYGAPDEKVWTDKSHAQVQAESNENEVPDLSLTYGADGKKLSNKERKKVLKAKQAAERLEEFEVTAAKSSREGAQFACSQTAINSKDPQWENALDINVPQFSISAAGKVLFKDASLNIAHGRRYGVIGANGRGKSTMLKMIASGDLVVPPRIDYLYVEQEVVADNTPAVEAVLKADTKRWALLQEEKEVEKAIDEGNEDPKKVERLQAIFEELSAMGSDSADAKARRILYGLGFDMEMQTKPTKMFSGGWRMRISLARALFIEPTLLMLDEPTNHLDLNAVIWLDDYLQKWKKTLLVVSHDQDFLNSICDEMLHIEDLKLVSYKGGYDSFKKAEKDKFKQHVRSWELQEKRLRALKKGGQSKAKATETVKKSKREPGARSSKKQNNDIAAGISTAKVAELIKRPREYAVKIDFTDVSQLSRPVMEVNQVQFQYSEKHPIIFEHIDFGIDMDSRICIVGPNGAGKSTLLKLLTGEIKATKGEVRRNPRLRMGIYNQHFVDQLPMGKTPVEHLRDRFNDEDYQSVRNRLGKYGLEGHAHEVAMRDLSGGQKARVVFVALSLQRPHILLLDEPTNNLDIETIEALVDAINAFNGGIVVVTHDQRLIEQCDCNLWVVDDQKATPWVAGFDDYKETLLRKLEEHLEKEAMLRQGKLEAAAIARAEKIARLQSKMKK